MYKLLSANGTDLRDPDGTYQLSKKDITNEYEGEDGHTILEIIRQGVVSGSVTYKGLTTDMLKTIISSLTTVTTFTLYDPMQDAVIEIEAKVSGISVNKVHHKGDTSVWSLSFKIDEL